MSGRFVVSRLLCAGAFVTLPSLVGAQEKTVLGANLVFFGDNTEFSGPFRDGETLFGTVVRLFADVEMSERVTVRLGAVAHHRFGGEDAFELVRPLLSLSVRSSRWALVFGSLETAESRRPAGPDRGGPHGLVPPLQRETLSFDRPAEAGLRWSFRLPRLRHDAWLNWQLLNTEAHRERFDAGGTMEIDVSRLVGLAFQAHVVHSGGQLFASGPVADSLAYGPGVTLRGTWPGFGDVSVEVFGLVSHFVPDRARRDLSRHGAGAYVRLQAMRNGWRGHAIVWRGDDFVKAEGDPNYLSVTMEGRRWRGTRDYSELGLARLVDVAPGVLLEVSGRVHRIEPHNYGYSYRVLALTDLRWRLH